MGRKYIVTFRKIIRRQDIDEEKKRRTSLGKALEEAEKLYEEFKKKGG